MTVPEKLPERIGQIAAVGKVPPARTTESLVTGWEQAVESALEDGVLSAEEESHLVSFATAMNLSQHQLSRNDAYLRVAMSATLRDILAGSITTRAGIEGDLPFNLKKSETLIWVFLNSAYYEERSRHRYVGSYQGASIRVMKGVYYRIGSFRGHPMETASMEHIDSGTVGITDEHIYFSGQRKSLRVAYSKVVSFRPYSDGIGFHRDATTAKPQSLVTGHGWFVYNLVVNLAE